LPPLILGHEAAGVAEDGEYKNRRVAINPLITCGECAACQEGRENLCAKREILSMPPREGAFAEYIAAPPCNLIPTDLPPQTAALAEPAAVSLHAVNKAADFLGKPPAGLSALIIGGGAIGILAAKILRAKRCVKITIAEKNPLRAKAASRGFAVVSDAADLPPFDIVIDAVGAAATRAAACQACASGGAIVHIGLAQNTGGIDARRITLQEIAFFGVYTYTMADFRAALALLASGALDEDEWTTRLPLSEGARAFAELTDGKCAAAKVILVL
jgi:threonine dehydrogenase-like Zn-dependent dehydrogenase